ncbi:MAG: hypothetical protein IT378_00985 [Sandaracinaceae bacterium]|nr:hypothetical protein [Sandaracinaceae bacterium]
MEHLFEIEERARRFVVAEGARACVGRDPSCEVAIDHPLLGRRALSIEAGGGACFATPTGPSGAFVEGYRLPARAPLSIGARVALLPDLHLALIARGARLDARTPSASWPSLVRSLFADLRDQHALGHTLDLGGPGSIFVAEDGRGYVLAGRATAEGGMLLHNPVHLAPERIGGAPTPASDVFALASIVYAELEGCPAWDAPAGALAIAAKLTAAPRAPTSSDRFARALGPHVMRALDRDPGRRPTAITLSRTAALGELQVTLWNEISSLAARYSGYRSVWAGVEPGDSSWDDYEDAKELYRFFLRWQNELEPIDATMFANESAYLAAAREALERAQAGGQGPGIGRSLLARLGERSA